MIIKEDQLINEDDSKIYLLEDDNLDEDSNSNLEKIPLGDVVFISKSNNVNKKLNSDYTEFFDSVIDTERLVEIENLCTENIHKIREAQTILDDLKNIKSELYDNYEILKTQLKECDYAIEDIKHIAQLNDGTPEQELKVYNMLKVLARRRGILKDYMRQYGAIKNTRSIFENQLTYELLKNEEIALNKIIEFQSIRTYTPRIIKDVEINQDYQPTKNISKLEIPLSELLLLEK